MKINVCFFVTALDCGGIENYLLRFLKEYHFKFNNIYIYCKSARDGVLDDEFTSFSNVKLVKNKITYFNFLKVFDLKKFFLSKEIHAICDFNGSFSAIPIVSAYMANTPVRLVFYRNSREKYAPSKLKDTYRVFLEKLILKFSTRILSNSRAALEYFYSNSYKERNDKFQVIYNGINIEQFSAIGNKDKEKQNLNIPKQSFVIGHVGRYDSQKNHVTIIETAKVLTKKYSDIHVVLIGKDVDSKIRPLIAEDNVLTERIHLYDHKKNINQVLLAFDVFFFPSTIEGNPNALIEAMVSGLPIVTSNIDAIKEAIPASMYQFLKDPMDTEGFVDLLEKAYLSDDFRNNLKAENWAIDNFDSKKKFKEFYINLTMILNHQN